jgi:DNA-binding response OmpR family regulator
MKRRILLVDDEVAILLTLQAVLEINGFEVETAASAREAKLKIRSHQYHMIITDLRMERDTAGSEVILAARKASYSPAVAMLTAFPMPGSEGDKHDADEVLVKPMHTKDLLLQIEALLVSHEDKKRFEQEHTLPTPKSPKSAGPRKLPAAKKAFAAKNTPAAKKSLGATKTTAKKAPAAKPKHLKPAKAR